MMKNRSAVIIGAGPAGLTAAFAILEKNAGLPEEEKIRVTVLEASGEIGGISRTVVHNGNRIDIGGHRFFSKSREVLDFWNRIMPLQGKDASDGEFLHLESFYAPGGPDPEKEESVMLIRRRVSRILYLRKFFDYPVTLSLNTIRNLGFLRLLRAGSGYLASILFKRKEKSLKDFMINRFGGPLYRMFFEKYTEKVWGRPPEKIDADWGRQRIRGLSLWKAFLHICRKPFAGSTVDETSLIERFLYPKRGPGQLWEAVADRIRAAGGEILLNQEAAAFEWDGDRIAAVVTAQGEKIPGDVFLSSMPIRDLAMAAGDRIPEGPRRIALALPYRDFITAGLLTDRLLLRNTTKFRTPSGTVPDCWIYIQEDDVRIGRLQIFNNWSPYMPADPVHTVWLGLEYFCQENDELWSMEEKDFLAMAEAELVKTGILAPGSVRDAVRIRVRKAYPAYFDAYRDFPEVREWLDSVPNLYCIGRNGQHRYNNMDHSMLTGMRAAELVHAGSTDKSVLWSVNADQEYHEEK